MLGGWGGAANPWASAGGGGGGGGDLVAANNLSDVDDPAAALENLGGLGGPPLQMASSDTTNLSNPALRSTVPVRLTSRTSAGAATQRELRLTGNRTGSAGIGAFHSTDTGANWQHAPFSLHGSSIDITQYDSGANATALLSLGSAVIFLQADVVNFQVAQAAWEGRPQISSSGATAGRPDPTGDLFYNQPGQQWFDTDLNQPIWVNATSDGWVDANGDAV